ncbi:MAG TPA: MFS transporter, partial [Bacilli bacterium]
MDKKAIRGWMMYDWANSAFATTMLAAVLPIFYLEVAAKTFDENLALSYWSYTNSIAMLLVAGLAPVLGAISDISGYKMRFLRIFAYAGMIATACFAFVNEGDLLLASVLFILGTVGFSGGNTFYDSLLTDLVPPEKRDMVSSQGYALGYVGGGVLLTVNLLMIQQPALFGFSGSLQATHAVFVSVAVWWFLFALPLFRHVRIAPSAVYSMPRRPVAAGFARLARTLRHLGQYPELLKFLLAFWLFNDGINTVITMAAA